ADRKELEDEKNRIAKAEADKKAKELAEALAIEKAETERRNAEKAELEAKAKAEREEALKPEKEKAIDFLNCLVFKNELPQITDAELLNHVESFVNEIQKQRNDLIEFITNL
ncbi:MAG: hypothetical protein LC112_11315, partial [Flavobacteriales bacterium]|nr:hypothetical protein [Flavobacteriales bacterium]